MASYGNFNINDTVKVNTTGVRVRSSTDTSSSSNVLYTAAKNDTMYIHRKKAVGNYYWYYVENKTQTTRPQGWIRGDFLKASGSTDDTPTNPTTLTDPSYDVSFSSGSIYGSSVRMRSEPNTSSSVTYYPQNGLALTLVAQFTNVGTAEQRRSWVYCKRGEGTKGYVYARYVQYSGGLSEKYIQNNSVNLRVLPTTSSDVITTLAKDTKVGVFATYNDWTRIGTTKGIGWVKSSFLGNTVAG